MTKLLTVSCKKYTETQHLSEIYSKGWQCAFATKDPSTKQYSQQMPWVHCKDYLNEVVWSNLFGKSVAVYGLSYYPNKYPVALDKTRILVRDATIPFADVENQCLNARRFLRDVDSIFGFRRTVLKRVVLESGIGNKQEQVFLFEADKRWLVAAPLLSLYTLLCRAGRFCTKEFAGNPTAFIEAFLDKTRKLPYDHSTSSSSVSNDRSYLTTFNSNKGMEVLPKKAFDIFSRSLEHNYSRAGTSTFTPDSPNTYALHNYGIVAFSKAKFPSYLQ